jgi:hypothetical protein
MLLLILQIINIWVSPILEEAEIQHLEECPQDGVNNELLE